MVDALAMALQLASVLGEPNGNPHHQALVKRYLAATAAMARAQAEFLDALAADIDPMDAREERPSGPRSLSLEQLKNVWDGVNEQARLILGAFAITGGAAPHDLMQTLGVDRARLLNGPLGGISRRVKKLLADPDAAFYSENLEGDGYILPQATWEALIDLIEQERPEWLTTSGPFARMMPSRPNETESK